MQRIIGESKTLSKTLSHVSLLAPLPRPILVIGERGSGKELIAERLHYLSPRWEEPLLKVNCAAMSESLLDSELFGHEMGAFTGASRVHIGRFERAAGGTLFLDELGTLPMRIQEKLLRIIEYGEFERLGGQKTLQVDVRIVAATNANLPQMAKEGQFRHDLLDRLAFDVVNVPPLRERKDDIPDLITHFSNRFAVEIGLEEAVVYTESAMHTFLNYGWPGNIRELKNAVERSICRWGEKQSPIDDVNVNPFSSTRPYAEHVEKHEAPPENEAQKSTSTDFKTRVQVFETQLIQQALEQCQHHQGKTAKYLGLSYDQLRALLKKYRDQLSSAGNHRE